MKKFWLSVNEEGEKDYKNSVAEGVLLYGKPEHNQEENDKIKKIKELLKRNKIGSRLKTSRGSNIRSMRWNITVSKADVDKAAKLIKKSGF